MNSFRLQSNPTSTFAYSQLNKTQALLNKNIQRLSSGLRINSAADDTAGSAMATRMTNQIRGMHQANKNSRDANNLLSTAEAGLNDISDLDHQRGHWRIQIGADNDIDSQHEFSIMNATDVGLAINDDKVLTVDNSRTAVTALDEAIDEVNRERSYLGSEQNKLQFTMSNLSSTINSIETARSNIEDVDYAAEMSDLAKHQILVQSGTAMLAQANMVSQNILQLLSN